MKKLLKMSVLASACLLAVPMVFAEPLKSVTLINDNPPDGEIVVFNLPSTVKAEVAAGMTTQLGPTDIRYLSNMKGKINISSPNGITFICGQTIKDQEGKDGKSALTSDEPDYLFEGNVTITVSTKLTDQGFENNCTFQTN
jgi:hypothetical protein